MTCFAAKSLAVCVCFAALPLTAQQRDWDWTYRLELLGEIAYGGFYNGDRKWGSGLDLGGGVGVRPFTAALRGLGFEARLAHIAEDKGDPATLATSLDSTMVAANAVYHVRGRTPVQPYVYGGLGVARVAYSSVCNTCVYTGLPSQGGVAIPQKSEVRATKAGLNLGCGIKIAINRRLSVRPEISFLNTTPGSGWNFGWVRLQMGLGLHF